MVEKCMVLGLLAALTKEDVRTKEVPLWCLIVSGAIGMLFFFAKGQETYLNILGGIGVGGFLLFIAAVFRGSIGMGDGFLFCVTGIYLGFRENLILLMTALLLAAGYAGALCLLKKCGKKTQIPFLPFALAAYLLTLCR